MSIILASSPDDCEHNTSKRSFEVAGKGCRKKLLLILSSGFGLVLFLILLIWMILHPSKPKFTLKEVDIYQFNLSDPHLLNCLIQLTLQTENPNSKVGIYYDEIRVSALYKGQQITSDSSIPPFYQGSRDNNLLTASLVANQLPVDSSLGYEVGRDQNEGKITLSMRINGRIRWKVGTWVSRRYQLNANCYVEIDFGAHNPITPSTTNQGSRCSTSL
ncbi:hypothetical protein MLD38_009041 [Melastoma candidum]|uniref:Uncharacterized protein n=1 Tax=Melastoma candidum TaxID=119954 RepID=A0ACB9RWG4_9MYRT|nr:hypothetical protein MLD38_009041 [Melastoma candidum]